MAQLRQHEACERNEVADLAVCGSNSGRSFPVTASQLPRSEPSELRVTLGSEWTSTLGRSPAMASSRSVRVTIPWIVPYSSTTNAVLTGVCLNKSSVRRIDAPSGTASGGSSKLLTSNSTPPRIWSNRSCLRTIPATSSMSLVAHQKLSIGASPDLIYNRVIRTRRD